jgi:hypothetical protein
MLTCARKKEYGPARGLYRENVGERNRFVVRHVSRPSAFGIGRQLSESVLADTVHCAANIAVRTPSFHPAMTDSRVLPRQTH